MHKSSAWLQQCSLTRAVLTARNNPGNGAKTHPVLLGTCMALCLGAGAPAQVLGGFDALQILKCSLDGVLKLLQWKGTWERTESIAVGEASALKCDGELSDFFSCRNRKLFFLQGKSKRPISRCPCSIHSQRGIQDF